jgi:hypothetical protein
VNGVGVAPGAIAIANGEVEALAGEIHAIVVGLNAQVHEWMRLAEERQSRQEPAGCEGADDTDADNAAEVTLFEPLQRCAQAAERIRDCRNESLSLVGQCQPAWQPAEQLDAQTRLQALDLVTDGRLPDTQLHARFGEAQMPRRGLEGAQRIERQMGLGHAQTLNFLMANLTNDRL